MPSTPAPRATNKPEIPTDASFDTAPGPHADPVGVAGSVIDAIDTLAVARLSTLARVQQARLAHQQRSVADATAAFGATSSQADAAQAALLATTATLGRVQLVQRQAQTATPVATGAGWVLHGRVTDADLVPQPRCTVYFVDGQNRYVETLGYAYTDATGYFLLRQGAAGTTTTSGSKRSAAVANPSGRALFVAVADARARPVYLASQPFVPAPGAVAYQDIALAPGGHAIGDPPDRVRGDAVPGKSGTDEISD